MGGYSVEILKEVDGCLMIEHQVIFVAFLTCTHIIYVGELLRQL